MPYLFFYGSMAGLWIILLLIGYFIKPLRLSHFVLGVTTAAVSLVYDTIFGNQLGLYYYISPASSNIYLVLGAILIYPLLNIIYVLFLPKYRQKVIIYTLVWIAAMLLFEYASVIAGTVVFTGWRAFPWSIVTYVFTYVWVYFFYRYLKTRRLSTASF